MKLNVTNYFFNKLTSLITLLRPKQWVKNSFVLAPLLFSGKFFDFTSLKLGLLGAIVFCAASSAAYIVNDIRDVHNDRLHFSKSKNRPLAAGKVSTLHAFFLLIILYILIYFGCLYLPGIGMIIAAYLILNIAYTFIFKTKAVLDIFTIAIGFVLRVFAGMVVINVPISLWMLITTLCLALYLASIKRRQELKNCGPSGRRVLQHYSEALLNRYAEISAIGAIIFYGIFVLSTKPQLALTIPFVLFGIFRYWYVVEQLEGGESPTDSLFSDRQLMLTVAIWIFISVYVIWMEGSH